MDKSIREKVIILRKSGKTYSEIRKIFPIAKSTISGWLKGVGISKSQIQVFTEKKRLAGLRGGIAKRN
jgi:transposase